MTAARSGAAAHGAPAPRRLQGWLDDGTPRYAPIGAVLVDGDRVCCHLCGSWFLCVTPHLRVHGWSKADYLAAFGLELSNSLSGEATHKRRAAALVARQVSEPAIRTAQRAARHRARTGELAAAAAAAATGRPHPMQRRRKTMAALSSVDRAAQAAANLRRGRAHVAAVAAAVATASGYATFDEFVAGQLGAGRSLAELSRDAGLHKDWMSRQVPRLVTDPDGLQPTDPHDRRWQPVIARAGFDRLAEFLHVRHEVEHRTVAAIAAEAGCSRSAVESALERHGITRTAHAAKRHDAARRATRIARALGFDSLADYITARRADGRTWQAMAVETDLPATTLRRTGLGVS